MTLPVMVRVLWLRRRPLLAEVRMAPLVSVKGAAKERVWEDVPESGEIIPELLPELRIMLPEMVPVLKVLPVTVPVPVKRPELFKEESVLVPEIMPELVTLPREKKPVTVPELMRGAEIVFEEVESGLAIVIVPEFVRVPLPVTGESMARIPELTKAELTEPRPGVRLTGAETIMPLSGI